jgi:hypothetical protein
MYICYQNPFSPIKLMHSGRGIALLYMLSGSEFIAISFPILNLSSFHVE